MAQTLNQLIFAGFTQDPAEQLASVLTDMQFDSRLDDRQVVLMAFQKRV
ncbi:hypothetical protein [Mesorhizobium sophorae]|nr:hypothetical protein [Mesorhizobium sophorae]